MAYYHLVGENISFPSTLPEIEIFFRKTIEQPIPLPSHPPAQKLLVRTHSFIGGRERAVEVWYAPPGMILKISDGADFYITPAGLSIVQKNGGAAKPDKYVSPHLLTGFDRESLLGPALILSLAMRSVWSLHASATLFGDQVIAFLGESGRGKSTLATYLSAAEDWQRVADDILPVTATSESVLVWPHFPQLKLPSNEQPGLYLPESLALNKICMLTETEPNTEPRLERLSTSEAIKAILCHTAGTRIFDASLLEKHLQFSAQVAAQIPVYQLVHPHRLDTMPLVREFLQRL